WINALCAALQDLACALFHSLGRDLPDTKAAAVLRHHGAVQPGSIGVAKKIVTRLGGALHATEVESPCRILRRSGSHGRRLHGRRAQRGPDNDAAQLGPAKKLEDIAASHVG